MLERRSEWNELGEKDEEEEWEEERCSSDDGTKWIDIIMKDTVDDTVIIVDVMVDRIVEMDLMRVDVHRENLLRHIREVR